MSNENTINAIKAVLKNDGRVVAAWLYGSLARGEAKQDSDVDLMVEISNKRNYSMFDLLDISYRIEQQIKRKVDLVEKGYLEDFAAKTAACDMIQIYG